MTAELEFVIHWREYAGKAARSFVFPGFYEIGPATDTALRFKQAFATTGRAIEFWISPA